MYAQIVRFQDDPQDLEDGISHVREEVVPAAEATAGVAGLWLVDRETGERLSVMVFENEERPPNPGSRIAEVPGSAGGTAGRGF